jgi:hypothetical protein
MVTGIIFSGGLGVVLNTHLFLAPWIRMGGVLRLRPLYAVMTLTRTTVPFTHIPFTTGFAVLLNLMRLMFNFNN